MGATNKAPQSRSFYTLKSKFSAEVKPHFAKSEKIDGKWKVTEKFNTISGQLIEATVEDKEYQGTPLKVLKLVMKDDDGIMQIDMNFGDLIYSIMSSLASITDLSEPIEISVYGKQNGQFYNSMASLKQGDKKLTWAFHPKDAPKPELIMKGKNPLVIDGKKVYDREPVKAFWADFFTTEIATMFTGEVSSESVEEVPETEKEEDPF